MKHIKSINELFGINSFLRKKFNSDEDIAIDIYNKLKTGKYDVEDPTTLDNLVDIIMSPFYNINIEDYQVVSKKQYEPLGGDEYQLFIDDNRLKSSNNINKKIFNQCKLITKQNKPVDDHDGYNPVDDYRRAFRTNRRR